MEKMELEEDQLPSSQTGILLSPAIEDKGLLSRLPTSAKSLRELYIYYNRPQSKDASVQTQISMLQQLFVILRLEGDSYLSELAQRTLSIAIRALKNGMSEDYARMKIKNMILIQKNTDSPFSIKFLHHLQVLLCVAPAAFGDVSEVLRKKLRDQESRSCMAALQCIEIFLKHSGKQNAQSFDFMAKDVIQAASSLIQKKYQCKLIAKLLHKMVRLNCGFFRNNTDDIISLVDRIGQISSIQQYEAMQGTISKLFQDLKSSSEFPLNPLVLQEIVQNVIERIAGKIGKYKMELFGAHNQKILTNQKQLKREMWVIDKMLSSGIDERVRSFTRKLILQLIDGQDQTYRFAAILAYYHNSWSFRSYCVDIIQCLKNHSILLRYATILCISQVRNNFSREEHVIILRQLLSQVQSERLSVTALSTMKAISYLVGQSNFEMIAADLEIIIQQQLKFITRPSSQFKDEAFDIINTIVSIICKQYAQSYPYLIEIIDTVLSLFACNFSSQEQSLKYKIKCIDVLAHIGKQIKSKKLFEPVLPRIVEQAINVQDTLMKRGAATYIADVFKSWTRLCQYKQFIQPRLDQIFPTLLTLAYQTIQQLNIYDITCMLKGMMRMKYRFLPYLEAFLNLLCHYLSFSHKQSYCTLWEFFSSLFDSYELGNCQQLSYIFKKMADILLDRIIDQTKWEQVLYQMEALHSICQVHNLFSPLQMQLFLKKWIKVLHKIDCIVGIDQDEEYFKEMEAFKLIFTFFEKQRLATKGMVRVMVRQVLSNIFVEGQTQCMLAFGVAVIVAGISVCGYQLLSDQWESYGAAISHFFEYRNYVQNGIISQAIGVLIAKTPASQMSQQVIEKWMGFLMEIHHFSHEAWRGEWVQGSKWQQFVANCSTTAVRRILKSHHMSFDLKPYFRLFLCRPLESNLYREALFDILIGRTELILGEDEVDNLKQLLQTCVDWKRQQSSSYLLGKINALLLSLTYDASVNAVMNQVWTIMTPSHRRYLYRHCD